MDEDEHVSLPRTYFNTLLRRAELHDDADSVTLGGKEYAAMQYALQQFEALTKALLAGGVEPNAIETLINSVLHPPSPTGPENDSATQTAIASASATTTAQDSLDKPRWSADAPVFVPKDGYFAQSLSPTIGRGAGRKLWAHSANIPPTPPSNSQDQSVTEKDEYDDQTGYYEEEEEQYENNHDDRSVVLRGLSPFTTLADIVKAVKGGIILNMFIRPRDRSAHVAFVDPHVAEKFVMHCKRNDLYVKGKRIEVYWDERQHYMPGHIARRIKNNNATRNLVIRFPHSDTTPDSLREDLEHIHNLEVVSCEMKNGHAFISTNGVANAITARSCMQSRLKYKKSRIDFYPDECDQPLPDIVKKPPHAKRDTPPSKSKFSTVSHINRFALLVDGAVDEFEDVRKAAIPRNLSLGNWDTKLATVPVP